MLALLPVMALVLLAFLVIGLGLPVLPLHVHDGLGFGPFTVGLVAGSQFAAAVVSRIWAGSHADRRGARRGIVLGLLFAAGGGLLYLLSLAPGAAPAVAVAVLVVARLLLGAAESFVITSGISWGFGLLGGDQSGRVIAWVGMAMFAAMALGAPLGTVLYDHGGFMAVAVATLVVPLAALPAVLRLPAPPPAGSGARPEVLRLARLVWLPGTGCALASVGFGAILAFGSCSTPGAAGARSGCRSPPTPPG
ncbi:MAG: MFS transporter [Geminicoccaceae bacterium]